MWVTYHVIVLLLLVFLLLLLLGLGGGRSGLSGNGSGDGECLRVGKVLLDLFRKVSQQEGRGKLQKSKIRGLKNGSMRP